MPSSNPAALGPALALATAALWACSSVVMAGVARRIGSQTTNLLRILLASAALLVVIFPAYLLVRHALGRPPPPIPTGPQWVWAILSGLAGLVLGDIFYYEALVRLGPRRAVKMNTLAPVFTFAIAAAWLGEPITGRVALGAALVLAAVAYAAFNRPEPPPAPNDPAAPADDGAGETASALPDTLSAPDPSTLPAPPVFPAPTQPHAAEPAHTPPAALLCGVLAALFIGLGAVLGRLAFQADRDARPLDPVVATVLRVTSAGVILWLAPLLTGRAGRVLTHLRRPGFRARLAAGTFCGPVAGMLCYVAALRLSPAGLVSTLMSTSTLIVIPIVAVRYRLRIGWDLAAAATVAILGVGLITWR